MRLHIPAGVAGKVNVSRILISIAAVGLFLGVGMTANAADAPKKLVSAAVPGFYRTKLLIVQPDLTAPAQEILIGNHPACPGTLRTLKPGAVISVADWGFNSFCGGPAFQLVDAPAGAESRTDLTFDDGKTQVFIHLPPVGYIDSDHSPRLYGIENGETVITTYNFVATSAEQTSVAFRLTFYGPDGQPLLDNFGIPLRESGSCTFVDGACQYAQKTRIAAGSVVVQSGGGLLPPSPDRFYGFAYVSNRKGGDATPLPF